MVQPIDYLGMLPQVDLGQSLLSGLQAGAAFRAVGDAQRERERQAALQAQYSADLQAAMANPTAQNFSALAMKYPDQGKEIRANYGLLSKDQQDSEFRTGAQVYTALRNNQPDIASQILDEQIVALENSGQDASELKSIKGVIGRDPRSATGYVGAIMSSIDPERWGKMAGEQRAASAEPFELSEKAAKAQKAAVDAKYAESNAAQELEKKGWQIQKLANDIGVSKLNSQIALMNAQLGREQNDLKKQELQVKLDERMAKRDAALNTKVAEVESGRATIDNFLNTADKVLKTPSNVVESATGTVSTVMPTFFESTADFEETLKTLGSQAFLSQVPAMKGLGALTEAEGRKLESSLANLSTRQSPEKLLENVQEAQRLMLKARANLSTKFGVPDVIPDRPAQETQPASSGFRVLGVE